MKRLSVLILMAALAGCASKPALTSLKSLQVEAAPDANFSGGTQVDVVFVFDPQTDAALPPTADLWFRTRAALRDAHPAMAVLSLQLPVNYPATAIALPAGYRKAIGIYTYSSYLAPAPPGPCALTTRVHAVLRLEHDHIDCAGD